MQLLRYANKIDKNLEIVVSADQSNLARIQSIASIVAAIAIPLVLAAFGYAVQQSIAKDGIHKDYVSIAMEILRESGSTQDPELKKWAVAVVTKYSPVPFSEDATKELERIQYIKPKLPELPEVARQESLGAICEPSCIKSLGLKIESWRQILSGSSNDLDALQTVSDESVVRNLELARALDGARISGNACSKIYDIVQKE